MDGKKAASSPEPGQVRVFPIRGIQPSPENDQIYRPVDPKDPEIKALARSIRQRGVIEPLVITTDLFILSGHRRYMAAKLAKLTEVPCRVEPISRNSDLSGFVALLREYNRQRDKSFDEKLREELVSIDPAVSYQNLIEHRRRQAEASALESIVLEGKRNRCRISDAKLPLLNAVIRVLNERRDYWPLTDRQIHYALLNDPPLCHASKPDSIYENTQRCYKNQLVDILTRARLAGDIPFSAIEDETRPVETWSIHRDVRSFQRQEIEGFCKNYWRDLMQSQPHHIEIVGEKMTLGTVLRRVAADYTIPLTLGRGFCSIPPRHAIAQRHKASGKAKLTLLLISDFDPDGESIAESFARSMRDDFGVADVHAVKVAITGEQVARYKLPPQMTAKKTSSRYGKFVDRHGEDVYEVEALPPDVLMQIVRDAVDSVIDVEAFNHEIDLEKRDAGMLEAMRRTVIDHLRQNDDDDDILVGN